MQTNENNLKNFAGIETVDSNTPNFETILERGDMKLYRIITQPASAEKL